MVNERKDEFAAITLRVPKSLMDFLSSWMSQEEIKEYLEELLLESVKSDFETERFQRNYLKITLKKYGLEEWVE